MECPRHDGALRVVRAGCGFREGEWWWWQGRGEIERQHATAHQTVFRNTQAQIFPKKLRFIRPDVAVVQASWRVTGDTRSTGPRDYIMTYVMRKQDGRWLIITGQ